MLNNFIYAQTKDLFLEALEAGNILDEAIVFIEDTKEIWNHGHYFGCGEEQYKGTVTGVKMNGRVYNPTDGLINLEKITIGASLNGTIIPNNPIGIIPLGNLATPEDLTTKQDTLISGTNIKTINGESILGSGDIEIISSGGGSTLIRTLYTADESSGKTLTEEQMAYNAETYRMLADGTSPIVVCEGLIGTLVATGGDENDGYADIFFKTDGGSYLAAISLLLKSDGSVELGEEHFAPKLAFLMNQEHAQMFFENYEVFTEMKGVFLVSANVSGMALAEVDFIGSENSFPYVEYNLHDKRFRVDFNADYTIKGGVEITPAGGGGSVDPELFEAYIPMMREFSDDFNNDFTR